MFGFVKIAGTAAAVIILDWLNHLLNDTPSGEVPSNCEPTRSGKKKKDEELPAQYPSHSQLASKPKSSKTNPTSPFPTEASSSAKFPFPCASDSVTQDECIWVQKGKSPLYEIPEDVECLIKQNKVPRVLRKPLSASTYKDYFAALLYAEDHYLEKWSDFKLFNVGLELKQSTINEKNWSTIDSIRTKHNKVFVSFEADAVPEKLPFLLARDFVFIRPTNGPSGQTFQGLIYRAQKYNNTFSREKSNNILVEFGQDFFSQHQPASRYDVSFSFNRVCLKRFHQAIEVASNRSCLRGFIFPDSLAYSQTTSSTPTMSTHMTRLDEKQMIALHQILGLRGSPPFLIEGQLALRRDTSSRKQLSRTGLLVKEAVTQLYRSCGDHRILVCAPVNRTCDSLLEYLKGEITEGDMFRANAAYRDFDEVPSEILKSCAYKGQCFACPPIHELQRFRVIVSTYVTSFRLFSEGIARGHFSHIFLVDASMAIEPEVMVAVGNLADEKTAVIVTGAAGGSPGSIRSDIARKYGLMTSYFERIRNSSKLYNGSSDSSKFISRLEDGW